MCPSSGIDYAVTVVDSPIRSGEIIVRDSLEANGDVRIDVATCQPDDGVPGAICIQNPSLEGTPIVTPADPFVLPGWNDCPSAFIGAWVLLAWELFRSR